MTGRSLTAPGPTIPAGRLPYAPLEWQLRLRWDAPAVEGRGKADHGNHGLFCDRQAAIQLGVRRDDIPRYRRHGITPRMADRLACHVGLHPLLVWGQAWLCAEIGACVRRQAQQLERKAAA
jgi:hypothetical protein